MKERKEESEIKVKKQGSGQPLEGGRGDWGFFFHYVTPALHISNPVYPWQQTQTGGQQGASGQG